MIKARCRIPAELKSVKSRAMNFPLMNCKMYPSVIKELLSAQISFWPIVFRSTDFFNVPFVLNSQIPWCVLQPNIIVTFAGNVCNKQFTL